jgi:hypothetical protein
MISLTKQNHKPQIGGDRKQERSRIGSLRGAWKQRPISNLIEQFFIILSARSSIPGINQQRERRIRASGDDPPPPKTPRPRKTSRVDSAVGGFSPAHLYREYALNWQRWCNELFAFDGLTHAKCKTNKRATGEKMRGRVRRRRPCCGRRAFPPFRKIPENVSHAGRPERTKTCLDFYVAAVRLLYGRDIKLYVRLRRTPSLSGTWTCTDKNGSDATFITSLDPKQKLATIEAAGVHRWRDRRTCQPTSHN